MTDLVENPANPLRDPLDRRLPRTPEPCALVIFGVTGDLSRKKLLPAIYDLANRGLLPPGFVMLGFARRDWGDGDSSDGQEAAWARPHPVAEWGVDPAVGQHQVRARSVDELRVRHPRVDSGRTPTTRGIPGNAAFYLSIPRPPSGNAQADGPRYGQQRSPAVAPGGGSRSGDSSAWLSELVDDVFAPDVFRITTTWARDSAEHPGAALRQRPVRAGVERAPMSTRSDHHGRGRRHRQPDPRSTRSAARRAAFHLMQLLA